MVDMVDMLSVTVQQCMDAVTGLAMLAKEPLPLPLAVRVARLRFAVQSHVDPINEAYEASLRAAADLDEQGEPVVLRGPGGLYFQMTPAAQLGVQTAYDVARKEVLQLDVKPLTAAELPSTLRGQPLTIAPEVLVALGPLFID